MAHGSEGSLRTYDRIVAGLKREYRIIRFDVPGYGLSDGATADAAASALPTDVPAKLLATLRVKDVTCLGVSSGGTMCLYLAARHPQLVRRLILSNMPSDPVRTDHMVQPERFLAAQRRAAETGYRDRNFWDQFLSFFAGDPARISARTRLEYYDFNRRAVEPYPHAMVARIGDGIEARAMMRTVTAPTLLIWGGRDQLLPIAASDTLASYLPNVPLSRLIMPDVGHYPPLESPERFAALVRAYLEQALPER
jgi:pimeloyl-ACP methyl ester carboxylesterase